MRRDPEINVLVVEDEEDMAEVIVARLRGNGFKAKAVNSGRRALGYVKKKVPDLIVLDFFMPEMDGGEVLRRLCDDKNTSDIPVIMLTSNISQKDKIEAFKEGVDDYLMKPYDGEELLARVKTVIKRANSKPFEKRAKNILITGGAGFIGSHLAKNLLKKRHNVYVIDNFSTGRMENIKDIQNDKHFHLITGSITDEVLLSKAIEQSDVVYHLAATVGVKNVVENPLDTIMYDTFGTGLVLKYASAKGVKVVLTSTSEVYGKATTFPFREKEDIILGPPDINRWSYACSKLLDEFLAMAYHRERKLPVVIVRLFNVVGPGQVGHYGMVVPRFLRNALTNRPICVYGDGGQSRCFTYIDDMIDILVKLADSEEANGQFVNIGNDQEISIKDLAQKVKKITGSTSEIVFKPYHEYYGSYFQDTRRRVPDLTRLKRVAGIVPQTGIDEILAKLIRYYKNNPEEVKRI